MRRARYDRTPRAFKLPNAKKLSRHLSTASSHGGIGQNKKQNLRISHAPAAHVFSVWCSGTITATNSDWKAMRVERFLTRNASIFDDQSESSAVSNAAFRSRRARDVPAGADMAASENVNSTRRYFWTARETTCAPTSNSTAFGPSQRVATAHDRVLTRVRSFGDAHALVGNRRKEGEERARRPFAFRPAQIFLRARVRASGKRCARSRRLPSAVSVRRYVRAADDDDGPTRGGGVRRR